MCQRIAEYQIEKCLGSGSFGEILLVSKAQEPGSRYVIKKIEKEKMKMVEVEVGEILEHEHIVKFYEHFQDQHHHYLVLEYVSGVDMFTWMEFRNFEPIPEKTARKIFRDICSAIQYCHQRGIAHRDLKLENILIDPTTYQVKVIDFGLASFETEDSAGCVDVCGSLDYLAPEVLEEQPYSGKKSDIWSLGVILYSMLFCNFPFSTEERMDALLPPEGQERKPHPPLEFPKRASVSREAKDLCRKMLAFNPDKRINIDKIMRHPWMEIDNSDSASGKEHNRATVPGSSHDAKNNNCSNRKITDFSESLDLAERLYRDFENMKIRDCAGCCTAGNCGSEVQACIPECNCRRCPQMPA